MYYVYITTNQSGNVMYVGVTNDLSRRIQEHKSELIPGFTQKYHVTKLVYFEEYTDVNSAIRREKQIKSLSRDKKNAIVSSKNSEWREWVLQ